jgi:hypothetical protein
MDVAFTQYMSEEIIFVPDVIHSIFDTYIFRGCLVTLLFQKNLDFDSSFYKMELNTMQKLF